MVGIIAVLLLVPIIVNAGKLNVKTEKYLEKADKNEQNIFIVKFKDGIDNSKLGKLKQRKNIIASML